MQSPHDILGVAPYASQLDIVTAFRTRAQILHPDRFHDASDNVQREAARLMRELNEAYASLTRTQKAARGTANGRAGSPRPSRTNGARTTPPPSSPSQDRWAGVPWDQAVRARERSAKAAAEARRAREESAVKGVAVARPRTARSPRAIHAGLGEALVTNRLPCRRCTSIQTLPDTWREALDETIYHCSICDNVLLAHRAKE